MKRPNNGGLFSIGFARPVRATPSILFSQRERGEEVEKGVGQAKEIDSLLAKFSTP